MLSKIVMIVVGLIVLCFLFLKLWRRAEAYEIKMRQQEMERNKKNARQVAQIKRNNPADEERRKLVREFLYGKQRRDK